MSHFRNFHENLTCEFMGENIHAVLHEQLQNSLSAVELDNKAKENKERFNMMSL